MMVKIHTFPVSSMQPSLDGSLRCTRKHVLEICMARGESHKNICTNNDDDDLMIRE